MFARSIGWIIGTAWIPFSFGVSWLSDDVEELLRRDEARVNRVDYVGAVDDLAQVIKLDPTSHQPGTPIRIGPLVSRLVLSEIGSESRSRTSLYGMRTNRSNAQGVSFATTGQCQALS